MVIVLFVLYLCLSALYPDRYGPGQRADTNGNLYDTPTMKYERVTAGFIRYPDGELLIAAARILSAMKASGCFAHPVPSLDEVEAVYADYKQAVLVASVGGQVHTARKREQKRLLADVLQRLAFYVNSVCDGDLAKLHASGFPVLAKRRRGQPPGTPAHPFLRDGRVSGEVAFGFGPVGRDMLYDYQLGSAPGPDGTPRWDREGTTSRSFRAYAAGFKPAAWVYFRVRARNKHGVSEWTSPVMWRVR